MIEQPPINTTIDTIIDITSDSSIPWRPVRPSLTSGVTGKLLYDNGIKAVITRIEPGGSFQAHRDTHNHLFVILEGAMSLTLDSDTIRISAGESIEIPTRTLHGYCNNEDYPLLLISLNIP